MNRRELSPYERAREQRKAEARAMREYYAEQARKAREQAELDKKAGPADE